MNAKLQVRREKGFSAPQIFLNGNKIGFVNFNCISIRKIYATVKLKDGYYDITPKSFLKI